MATLGKAVVNIMANLGPLKRGLMNAQIAVRKMVTSISSGAFSILSSGLKKIITVAKLASVAILGIGVASVKLAMEAEETENLFTVSMGNMAEAAQQWAMEYSKSMGLFSTATKRQLGTLNTMFNSMGLGADEAYEMSKALVKLANDMASFYNLSPDEAFLKLQAGITGEAESLKRLGILVNENTILQMAANDETMKGRKELTEQEKVQYRYKAIISQTSKAQGDLGRTLNSTTNIFRTIKAQIFEAGVNIGKVFLPVVTQVSGAVRDWLKGNQEQIIAWAETIKEKVMIVIAWVQQLIELGKGGQWDVIFTQIGMIFKSAITAGVEFLKQNFPAAKDLGYQIGQGIIAGIKGTVSEKTRDKAIGGGSIAAGAIAGSAVGGPMGGAIGAGAGAIYGAGRVDARLIHDIFGLLGDLRDAIKQNNRLAEILNEQ